MTLRGPKQQILVDTLMGKGDVPIAALYDALGGPPQHAERVLERRGPRGGGGSYAHAWISTYIRRTNQNLTKDQLRIEPGALKRTYRLVSTK